MHYNLSYHCLGTSKYLFLQILVEGPMRSAMTWGSTLVFGFQACNKHLSPQNCSRRQACTLCSMKGPLDPLHSCMEHHPTPSEGHCLNVRQVWCMAHGHPTANEACHDVLHTATEKARVYQPAPPVFSPRIEHTPSTGCCEAALKLPQGCVGLWRPSCKCLVENM